MIGATLTTRLAQDGIDKRAITAFALAFLVYNLKWLWAWVVDSVRLPLLGRLGQRVSWLLLAGVGGDGGDREPRGVDPEGEPRGGRLRGDPGRRSRARPTTSSSTPTGSSRSSPASSASARACRSTAGASARSPPARWRWWWPRASAGRSPTSRARCSRCPRWWSGSCSASRRHREPGAPRGLAAVWQAVVGAARRVLPAPRRVAGAAVRAAAQDRRHAGQPDVPAAVQRAGLQQRRDRAVRRGLRLLGVPDRHLPRRRAVLADGAEARRCC
jgi:hypothetical protein